MGMLLNLGSTFKSLDSATDASESGKNAVVCALESMLKRIIPTIVEGVL